MKALISAYACEPGKGSEPGVGWSMVMQGARFHEVWVITRANNREAIERALAQRPAPNVHWVYFDLPRWLSFWKKGQRGIQPYYYLWQVGAYVIGRRLHARLGFDLVHHLTFVKYWTPSFLALLPIPFLWGPVGGGESTPKAFRRAFGFRGMLYEGLRDAARWLGEHDPFLGLTARRARLAIATTHETKARLERLGCRSIMVCPEVGMGAMEITPDVHGRNLHPFRLVSIGRLLHWKGFHLGLMAFAQVQREWPDSEYHLLGDGPERRRLERLAQKLGIASKVWFWGNLPRQEVLQKLLECDVLVHPSLHDSGGWVCLEAMAAGLPVICLDLGGPAVQVTEETGIKVSAITSAQAVSDLAKAMHRLIQEPALRDCMAKAGRRRVVEEFLWDQKGAWLDGVYTTVFSAEM
jgi:glycosyltransferase involved in cell wall biosynthesis